jgi:hypothetical protein
MTHYLYIKDTVKRGCRSLTKTLENLREKENMESDIYSEIEDLEIQLEEAQSRILCAIERAEEHNSGGEYEKTTGHEMGVCQGRV